MAKEQSFDLTEGEVEEYLEQQFKQELLRGGVEQPLLDAMQKATVQWKVLLAALKTVAGMFQANALARRHGEESLVYLTSKQAVFGLRDWVELQFGSSLGAVIWAVAADSIVSLAEQAESSENEAMDVLAKMKEER